MSDLTLQAQEQVAERVNELGEQIGAEMAQALELAMVYAEHLEGGGYPTDSPLPEGAPS
jgi:hypothetical protein